MPAKATKWFGMRLTAREKDQIERLAKHEGASQKEAVLEAVGDKLRRREKPVASRPGSALEGIEDLVGTVGGPETPRDLSNNKEYLSKRMRSRKGGS